MLPLIHLLQKKESCRETNSLNVASMPLFLALFMQAKCADYLGLGPLLRDTEHAHWVQYLLLVIKGHGHEGGHTEHAE